MVANPYSVIHSSQKGKSESEMSHTSLTLIHAKMAKSIKIEDIVEPPRLHNRIPLSETYPEVAVYWNYKRNCGWGPEDFSAGSNIQAWWTCVQFKRHKYQQTILSRVKAEKSGSKIHGCIFCRGFIADDTNSLANFPKLAEEWLTKKNGRSPKQVVAGSADYGWWRCSECSFEWQAKIYNRTWNESDCPACASKEWNSLASCFPIVAKEWHQKMNGTIKPTQVTHASGKKYWWQCRKNPHHVWLAKVSDRTAHLSGCPRCIGR